MAQTVRGLSGQTYQLGTLFKSGGEGEIWTTDKPGLLAKLYKKVTQKLEDKLKFMVYNPPSPRVLSQLAWPQEVISDTAGRFIGLVMGKLDITDELDFLYTYPPTQNSLTFKQKLIVAQNITVVISEVHKAGYVFGDFNPQNIGVNRNTGLVGFLDTDTYHIVRGSMEYRCIVGFPGYVAPELLGKIAREGWKNDAYALASLPTFTRETDYFALGIHIFKLLMNGYTPFCGVPVNNLSALPGVGNQGISQDSYCFKPGYRPLGPAVPPAHILPPAVADLFNRAFIQGRSNPSARPTADEWRPALLHYENSLTNCQQNPVHHYYNLLNGCPWCWAENEFKQVLSRPASAVGGTYTKPPPALIIANQPVQRTFTDPSVQQPTPTPIQPVQQTPKPASVSVPKMPVSDPSGFVHIQGGTFTMGSPPSEPGRYDNEVPHQVTVSAFYMGKYEVTQQEYQDVMGKNPSQFKGGNLPVETVSWYDAIEYCNKRSQREGLTPAYTINGQNVVWNRRTNGYRLPTEAEWEYACRSGTTTPYYTGSSVDTAGWYTDNSGGTTHPVGQKQANAWGLYDMHGNVWEWCWDWYGDYSISSQPDPLGAVSGADRVGRGGSWGSIGRSLRSAYRIDIDASGRYYILGFRLVRP